jgi:hypothetical protein
MKTIATLFSLVTACHLTVFTGVTPVATVVAKDSFEVVPEPAADVLFVIDDSGSMEEEQFNLMANLSVFIDALQSTEASIRFATITTNTKGLDNAEGNFFIRPINANGEIAPTRDTKDSRGVIRDIPDAFCDEVLARSANGVLELQSPALQELLLENNIAGDLDPTQPGIQILDFMGRAPGTQFVDEDNDPTHRPELPNQMITASFVDEVGCILAVGISGDGFEAGLCKAAASLDADSLAGNNAAFLTNPDSVLAVIIIGDEDDCTLDISTENDGKSVRCEVPSDSDAITAVGSLLCSQRSEENICGTGVTGLLDQLVPTSVFVDALKALRSEEQLFIATIVGPPTLPVALCGGEKNVKSSCEAQATGSAAPGNRFLSFVDKFKNTIDSFSETQKDTAQHLVDGICGDFGDSIAQISARLSVILDTGCLPNAPIDTSVGGFDIERDMRLVIDLEEAGVTCDAIVVDTSISGGVSGAPNGAPVTEALNPEKTRCLVRRDVEDDVLFLQLVPDEICPNGFTLVFLDFTLPNHSKVTAEYISSPD